MNDRCVNCGKRFSFGFEGGIVNGWEQTHCKNCGEPMCLACMAQRDGLCSDECLEQFSVRQERDALAVENAKLRRALGRYANRENWGYSDDIGDGVWYWDAADLPYVIALDALKLPTSEGAE